MKMVRLGEKNNLDQGRERPQGKTRLVAKEMSVAHYPQAWIQGSSVWLQAHLSPTLTFATSLSFPPDRSFPPILSLPPIHTFATDLSFGFKLALPCTLFFPPAVSSTMSPSGYTDDPSIRSIERTLGKKRP